MEDEDRRRKLQAANMIKNAIRLLLSSPELDEATKDNVKAMVKSIAHAR